MEPPYVSGDSPAAQLYGNRRQDETHEAQHLTIALQRSYARKGRCGKIFWEVNI
jgi:hypothetical protein